LTPHSADAGAPTVIGNRYVLLDVVGEGGMGVVYRVHDRLTGAQLALKKVTRSADDLEFSQFSSILDTDSFAIALANEFQILAHLRHPHIVSVLDYGFDTDRRPYFTMDLLHNARRITDAAQEQPQPERVRLLVQLLEALGYLHRRGIIHRDLKPQNVLVDANGQVRALDFGLALSEKYAQQTNEFVQGTFAYMAPEILRGETAQVATDLYGFGLIAYQVLGGDFPYDISNMRSLVRIILNEPPDLSRFEDPNIAFFLGRLLDKTPEDRYRDVDETMQALCDATGYPRTTETLAIRESYLQTAPFAGRADEMNRLLHLLNAAQGGSGGICLIEGESGVGKSRLLEELRVRALVENMLVLNGQEIAEGSSPYQVWRGVLQWLCLTTDLTDLEAQVLKELVPNIGDILQREVLPVPELSGQAAQERLISVVAGIFRRQSKPLVVILEDLQWSGQESIRLLREMAGVVGSAHILILGSYRFDETPHLSDQIPGAEVLRLERFSSREIAEVARSIYGVSKLETQTLAFLQRETEGNAFFVIETVRALADSAGELRNIASASLIAAGGVIAVLQQRLSRVSDDARALLEFAAIIGREIDVLLLSHLSPQTDLQSWLIACADAAVLEAQETRWYFAHDKLREFMVDQVLQGDEARGLSLHAQVAAAIEALYGDQEQYIAALAYHWWKARVADKAAHYLEKAAFQARRGAPSTAIDYVQKAQEFDAELGDIGPMRLARRRSLLGNAYYDLGDYKRAEAHLQAATEYLGASVTPAQNWQIALAVLQQVGVQFLHRRAPWRYLGRRSSADVDDSIYNGLFNKQVVYSYQGNMLKVLHAGLVALNTVETLETSEVANPAMAYGALTLATGIMGLQSLADYYRNLTNAILPQAGEHQRVLARALLGIYAAGRADWDEARETIGNVVNRFNEVGAFHSADESVSYLGRVYAHCGDYDLALDLLSTSYARARQRNDRIIRFQLFGILVLLLIRRNSLTPDTFDDMHLLTDTAAAEAAFSVPFAANPLNRGMYQALRALYFLSLGDDVFACAILSQSAQLTLDRQMERGVLYFELYALLPEISFALQNSGVLAPADRARAADIFPQAAKKLSKYARTFTLAQPRANLYAGWLHHAAKPVQATDLWRRSLHTAQSLHMPYDQALAHAALARAEGIPEAERALHTQEARRLLEGLNAAYNLSNLDETAAKGSPL
jgi:hypothetical protein